MPCWPASVAGAFSISLLLLDIYVDNWDDLPTHGLFGIVFTGIFLGLCSLVNESVSGAVLVVPAVLLVVFGLTIWFVGTSLRNRGCCLQCSQQPSPDPAPCPGPAPVPTPICTNPFELKAKALM
jgi:hypothetical protein